MLTLFTQLVAMVLATAVLVPLLRQRMTTPRAVGASACLAVLSTAVLTVVLIFGPAGDDLYAPKLASFIGKYALAFLACWGTLTLIALSAAGMVRIHRDCSAPPSLARSTACHVVRPLPQPGCTHGAAGALGGRILRPTGPR